MALLLSTAAGAQPAAPTAPEGACAARIEAIEQEMSAARARGQMLRRRELEATLREAQAECGSAAANASTPGARIRRQEDRVDQLRLELRQAEDELRRLRAERS